MSDYDFKAALEALNLGFPSGTNDKAIRFALRLADRLQRGEISVGMINAALERNDGPAVEMYSDIFKAMTAKLMEEIEHEG